MGKIKPQEGRLWQISFNNPYRDPPDGWPRVLAEMFTLQENTRGGEIPAEIDAFPSPPGYGLHITHVGPPPASRPPEVRASIRRKRLAARNAKSAPLFAEVFTAEEIAANPMYYVEGKSAQDAAREEAESEWRKQYERMLSEHGKLIVYKEVR